MHNTVLGQCTPFIEHLLCDRHLLKHRTHADPFNSPLASSDVVTGSGHRGDNLHCSLQSKESHLPLMTKSVLLTTLLIHLFFECFLAWF